MAEFKVPAAPSPEVIRYFAEKTLVPSFSWKDVWGEEHAHAFTVAKSAGFDVLDDIKGALQESLEKGETLDTFKKKLEPVLIAKGWWGRKVVIDPKTGEKVVAQLGSQRRLRVIFEANTRAARAAGQWERAQRTKAVMPCFEYRLGPSENHRPLHAEKSGLILPVDDPFWDAWFPPNGWGCKCWLSQLTPAGVKARGGVSEPPYVPERDYFNSRRGVTEKIPAGIDPGWHTSPGRARARGLMDAFAARIDAAPPENARSAIAGFWASAGPRVLMAVPERILMPAGISERLKREMGARSAVVSVSNDTIRRKAEKHKAIALESFAAVQQALDEGDHVGVKGRALSGYRIWISIKGAMHRLAVKKSETGYLYVSTFFRSGSGGLEKDKR